VDRSGDGLFRVAALARVNRHILESAKSPESHLRGDIQAQHRHHRHRHHQRMECLERPVRDVQPREADEHGERGQHENGADLVHPSADAESSNRQDHQCGEYGQADPYHEPARPREAFAVRSKNVAEVLRHLDPGLGGIEDGEEPEIPRDQEARQLTESEFGPLIQSPFEGIGPIEVNDDQG